jgi:methylmalonyl-CoA mutase N-terminal domain/subunit
VLCLRIQSQAGKGTTFRGANCLHTNAFDEAVTTPAEESVLGAMETGYQRGRIQDESMQHYEMLKHTGELPIIGVNTFRNPHGDAVQDKLELARSTDEEKQSQLTRLQDFHARHASEAPARHVSAAKAKKNPNDRGTIRPECSGDPTGSAQAAPADAGLTAFFWTLARVLLVAG